MSNLAPSSIFGDSAALPDCFVHIELAARSGEADSTLLKTLTNDISGFINCFLTINPNMLQKLTRATLIKKDASFENNIMSRYVHCELTFDKNSCIIKGEFTENFGKFVTSVHDNQSKKETQLSTRLAATCSDIFSNPIHVTRTRLPGKSRVFLYHGVRFLKKLGKPVLRHPHKDLNSRILFEKV